MWFPYETTPQFKKKTTYTKSRGIHCKVIEILLKNMINIYIMHKSKRKSIFKIEKNFKCKICLKNAYN